MAAVVDWVALGSAPAALVAVALGWLAYQDSRRTRSELAESRAAAAAERAADAEEKRAAQRRVFGWASGMGVGNGGIRVRVWIQNATDHPLNGVGVNVLGDPRDEVCTMTPINRSLDVVPPGQTRSIDYDTDAMCDLGGALPLFVVVTFRDCDGELCCRHPDGILEVGTIGQVRFPPSLDGPPGRSRGSDGPTGSVVAASRSPLVAFASMPTRDGHHARCRKTDARQKRVPCVETNLDRVDSAGHLALIRRGHHRGTNGPKRALTSSNARNPPGCCVSSFVGQQPSIVCQVPSSSSS